MGLCDARTRLPAWRRPSSARRSRLFEDDVDFPNPIILLTSFAGVGCLALRRAIFDGFAAAAAQELFGFGAAVGAAALEPFEGGELLELLELLVDFSMSCELGLHALVYGAAQL